MLSNRAVATTRYTPTFTVQKRRLSGDKLFYIHQEKPQITKYSLPEHASTIQDCIYEEDFHQARVKLEDIQDYLDEYSAIESREEEQEFVSWKIYTARQLAGVYHELGREEEALRQCEKVLSMEKQCKRLGLLDESFCDLNFACAVKAEILANRGDYKQALKYQNFLIDGRLRKRLLTPIFDHTLRRVLRKTFSLELATRGKMHLAIGNLEDALKDFEESLATSEIDPYTLLLKARVLLMKSEYKLALANARECLSISSNSFTRDQATMLIDQCLMAQQEEGEADCY